jgi:hypothetical protein
MQCHPLHLIVEEAARHLAVSATKGVSLADHFGVPGNLSRWNIND